MRLEFHCHWLRLLIELPPELPVIRRYRVTPAALDASTCRLLRQRIIMELRRGAGSQAGQSGEWLSGK